MPLSNSEIRRYTPPTCTLEVLAQNSPLSRWMGKSVMKLLSFELRFDDPRLPEVNRIAVRGNREQLEALSVAVTNYVQQFLQHPADNFWETFNGKKELDQNVQTLEDTNKNDPLTLPSVAIKNNSVARLADREIRLEPSNHLTHNLFLGTLANPESGSVIKLSLLQLFDLATALDEYSTDIMALPTPSKNPRPAMSIPQWAPVAAVLVLAASLTPFTIQYANRQRQRQVALNAKKTAKPEQVALQTPNIAEPTLKTPQTLLTPPSDGLPALPNLDGSTLPSASTLPGSALPGSVSTLPGFPTAPSTSTLPVTPGTSATKPTQPGSNTLSPSLQPGSSTAGTSATIPALPTLPNPPKNAIASTRGLGNTSKIPESQLGISTSRQNPLPSAANTKVGAVPPSAGTALPNFPANFPPAQTTPPPLLTPSGAIASSTRTQPSSSSGANVRASEQAELIAKIRGGGQNQSGTEAANRSPQDTSQIEEARNFLKKRWSPPSGLRETMQYSIVIDVDGSIRSIEPLNRAARNYVDISGLPLIGERFVSPNKNGQSVRMRAVFKPDGKVQTLKEAD